MKKIICLLLIVGLPTYVFAEVFITPTVGLETMLDDNIYLDSSGEVTSVINSLNFGMALSSRKPSRLLSVSLGGKYLSYSKDPKRNNDFQSQIGLIVENKFASGLSVGLRNNLLQTSDPATSELTDRLDRIHNKAELNLGYIVSPKTSVNLKGGHSLHEYDDSDAASRYDRSRIDGSLSALFRFLPRTSALIEYNIGAVQYDKAKKDSVSNSLLLGIKGNPGRKISVLMKAGYKARNYDDSGFDDFSTPIAELDLRHKLSPLSTLNLKGNYKMVESFYGPNPHYTEVGGLLALERKLQNSFSLKVSAGYKLNSYPEKTARGSSMKKRSDNILLAVAEVSHPISEWGTLSLKYEFKDRDSSHSLFDYRRNRISLLASVAFDLFPDAIESSRPSVVAESYTSEAVRARVEAEERAMRAEAARVEAKEVAREAEERARRAEALRIEAEELALRLEMGDSVMVRDVPEADIKIRKYRVRPWRQSRDSLSNIAYKFYGDHKHWRHIYDFNKDIIQNPDLILEGQELVIPYLD